MNNKDEYRWLDTLFDELWPLPRSLTGPGVEQTLELISQVMPLEIERFTSGSQVFDWVVPPEWHLRRGRLIDPDGKTICDTNDSNLHIVIYSEPVDTELGLDELQERLHSLPHLPDAIPYVTSYYKRTWGFCMSHDQRSHLREGTYRAIIETEFVDGSLALGHATLPGESEQEVLLTSYICHPSLANNELSGPLVLAALYTRIAAWRRRRFTYRFLLNPETIGALCYLSRHHERLRRNLEYGLILTCLGGPVEALRYKASRQGGSTIDRVFNAAETGVIDVGERVRCIPYSPLSGSDERQYGAPGFKLPMGQVARTVYGEYPGYHNSLDNKDFMRIDQLQRSADSIEEALSYAEVCGRPVNLSPFGEPQLGRRGLYPTLNSESTRSSSDDGTIDGRQQLNAILQLLSMADGNSDIFEIAAFTNVDIRQILQIVGRLEDSGLISFGAEVPT